VGAGGRLQRHGGKPRDLAEELLQFEETGGIRLLEHHDEEFLPWCARHCAKLSGCKGND
jgi:hypothetical protein